MNSDAIEKQIDALPATMSDGQRALETLSIYRSASLSVPDDVLDQIDDCYQHFISGMPVDGWVSVEKSEPSPLTLRKAFGVPDIRGGEKSALKRKRLALATPQLVALFYGQGKTKLSRTDEGYAEAARRLSLTASEVEDWVTKYIAVKRTKKTSK